MRTPPFLLGAGLLFWGWQAGHLIEGAVMAAVLEGASIVRVGSAIFGARHYE